MNTDSSHCSIFPHWHHLFMTYCVNYLACSAPRQSKMCSDCHWRKREGTLCPATSLFCGRVAFKEIAFQSCPWEQRFMAGKQEGLPIASGFLGLAGLPSTVWECVPVTTWTLVSQRYCHQLQTAVLQAWRVGIVSLFSFKVNLMKISVYSLKTKAKTKTSTQLFKKNSISDLTEMSPVLRREDVSVQYSGSGERASQPED